MEKQVLEIKSGKKIILIIFGGIFHGCGIEIPPFEFVNSLKEKQFDMIFVRDFKQAWYSFGIEGMGGNTSEIATSLKNKTLQYDYVITLGNSMGGYASILFAEMIEANFSIAINPQTFIDKKNRMFFKDNRWNENISKIHEKIKESPYFDLKFILENQGNEKTRHLIFFGENDKLDKTHAIRMIKNKKIELFLVKDSSHDAAKQLRTSGILNKVLDLINPSDKNFEKIINVLTKEKNIEKQK